MLLGKMNEGLREDLGVHGFWERFEGVTFLLVVREESEIKFGLGEVWCELEWG